MATLSAMNATDRRPSDQARGGCRRLGGRLFVCVGLLIPFLILSFGLTLSGASGLDRRPTWTETEFSAQIAPRGVSLVGVSVTGHLARLAFSRVIADRLEARLDVDASVGVELSARVRIVDLIPLEIMIQAGWCSPPVFAARWQLGPAGIDLTRELKKNGTMWASSAWAVSDRFLVGVGWTGRSASDRADHSWVVWAQILSARRWVGWRLWIGAGEGGISCDRAWVG